MSVPPLRDDKRAEIKAQAREMRARCARDAREMRARCASSARPLGETFRHDI